MKGLRYFRINCQHTSAMSFHCPGEEFENLHTSALNDPHTSIHDQRLESTQNKQISLQPYCFRLQRHELSGHGEQQAIAV